MLNDRGMERASSLFLAPYFGNTEANKPDTFFREASTDPNRTVPFLLAGTSNPLARVEPHAGESLNHAMSKHGSFVIEKNLRQRRCQRLDVGEYREKDSAYSGR